MTPATYCLASISTVAESHSICSVFGLYRTPNTPDWLPYVYGSRDWDTTEIFAELVEDLGLHLVEDGQLERPDLVMFDAGGRRVLVELKRLSTPSPTQVSRLIADGERGRPPMSPGHWRNHCSWRSTWHAIPDAAARSSKAGSLRSNGVAYGNGW